MSSETTSTTSSTTSSTPPAPTCIPIPTTGTIQVRKSADGMLAGYISKNFDGFNSYALTADPAVALTVSLPSTGYYNTPIDITATNGPDANHPLVGAVGGSSGYQFGTAVLGYAYLTGTGHTDANSPPSSTAGHSIQALGYNGPSESQIWTLNCLTLEFTAQWTNPDSTQPATSVMYDPAVDYIGLTGDQDAFNGVFPGEGAYAVTLTFVPTGEPL